MKAYPDNVAKYTELYNKTNKKYNSISLLRLLSIALFLFFMFYYIKTDQILYVILAVLSFAGFIVLMRIHSRLSFQKLLAETLLKINQNEIAFLKREKTPFENGAEFIDFHHPYAYDLDIFGDHSLFQNLNRTASFIGKKTLAELLLNTLPQREILENQEAVKELKSKIDWRQEFQALAIIGEDSKQSYEAIKHWTSFKNNSLPKVLIALSIILPVTFFGFLTVYFITSKTILLSYLTYVFIANLIVFRKISEKNSIGNSKSRQHR
jgi:DNA integrity scanning protein DisA with diadenylate cyclase activity